MRQSKFSLADVLAILTALAFGFICFLGKNFYTLGSISESIIWAVIITVSLASTAYIAKILKRTTRNFKTNFILEIFVLFLFTGLLIYFACSPFPHYFNVSAKKTEIQKKLQTSIIQAENMFAKYESHAQQCESTYRGKLDAAVAIGNPSELNDLDFRNDVPLNTQIDHKMNTLHTNLFPNKYSDTSNNKGIKEVATAWLAKAKKINNNWKSIGIVTVVNNVEKNSNAWLNQLIDFSKVRETENICLPFEYELQINEVKTHFTTLGKPTHLSIGLALGAYLMMLFSYLITKRSSKTTIGANKEKGEFDIDF
jgi:hypothetical protein